MNMNYNNTAEAAGGTPPLPLPDLVQSLEQATMMAKHLPATTDPNHLLQIYSSLYQAHHHLSSFISHAQFPAFPLQPTPPLAATENSLSSATGAVAAEDENVNEPMQLGDDDYEENSKLCIDRVEERMRDCFIKNKRPKRPLSPSSVAVAEERRLCDDGYFGGTKGFDPYGTRLKALDLIYQFHA